jgi:hypothetical protein
MATLKAYFDEAGTDKKKPAVTVGCYIATTEQWDLFSYYWGKLRDEEQAEYFHRVDLESLQGQFRGWTKDRKERVYRAQHRLIKAYTIRGIAGAVMKADYDEIIVGHERQVLGNAYEFGLRHCLAGVANLANELGYAHDIEYIFEAGAEGQGHFDAIIMKWFRDDPELQALYRVGSWTFADKKQLLPLQAADALAYEVAKDVENSVGTPFRPVRKSGRDLVRSTDSLQSWNTQRLVLALEEVRQF